MLIEVCLFCLVVLYYLMAFVCRN